LAPFHYSSAAAATAAAYISLQQKLLHVYARCCPDSAQRKPRADLLFETALTNSDFFPVIFFRMILLRAFSSRRWVVAIYYNIYYSKLNYAKKCLPWSRCGLFMTVVISDWMQTVRVHQKVFIFLVRFCHLCQLHTCVLTAGKIVEHM
jgi:hypothetical protein